MPTVEVLDRDKKKVGTLDLSDDVFAVKVNFPLVHQVLKAQLASRRRGTAKTKTKAEVRGGGKKPYKQKGTGNARRGSSRSPLICGGGQSHGPVPRSYRQRTPRKMVRGALCSALSDRLNESRLFILKDFQLDKPKTKVLLDVLHKTFKVEKALLIDDQNRNLELSGRNIANVKVLRTGQVNVYDLVKYPWLFLTQASAKNLQERLLGSE